MSLDNPKWFHKDQNNPQLQTTDIQLQQSAAAEKGLIFFSPNATAEDQGSPFPDILSGFFLCWSRLSYAYA